MGCSNDPSFLRSSLATQARLGATSVAEVSNPFILEAFSITWEKDCPQALVVGIGRLCLRWTLSLLFLGWRPLSSWRILPMTPLSTKSLIRRGFFGLRVVSPSPVVLTSLPVAKQGVLTLVDDVLPSPQVCSSSNGEDVMESRKESGSPINSSPVSTSQVLYTRWVKEEVAKQLNKNKNLIVEAVGVSPVVGKDRVANALNLTPVPKVKGMRELKNLDCYISLVKSQRRRGWLGSKRAVSFPPEVH